MSDRDGGIDLVFPVCSHHSTSSGIGSDCSINIAYNKQAPLCSGETTTMNSDGSIKCRGWGELCVADGGYEFSFSSDDPVRPSSRPLASGEVRAATGPTALQEKS
jgi:integrin alpha FG-GAP repeat containing protein 1